MLKGRSCGWGIWLVSWHHLGLTVSHREQNPAYPVLVDPENRREYNQKRCGAGELH